QARHQRRAEVAGRRVETDPGRLSPPDRAAGIRGQPARRRARHRAPARARPRAGAPLALPARSLAVASLGGRRARHGHRSHAALRALAAPRYPSRASGLDPQARCRNATAGSSTLAGRRAHRGGPGRARLLAGGVREDRRALRGRAGGRAALAWRDSAARHLRRAPAPPRPLARLAPGRGQSPPSGLSRGRGADLARSGRDAHRRRGPPRAEPARRPRRSRTGALSGVLLHRHPARSGRGLPEARDRPYRPPARPDPRRSLSPGRDQWQPRLARAEAQARGHLVSLARVRADLGRGAARAPYLATARAKPEDEGGVQSAVIAAFPNVTVIPVREVLERLSAVLDQIALAIRLLAGVSVATGLIVTAGALGVSRYQRLYQSVLLKALGATRGFVARLFAVEYALLGMAAGLCGSLLAAALAWGVLHWALDV